MISKLPSPVRSTLRPIHGQNVSWPSPASATAPPEETSAIRDVYEFSGKTINFEDRHFKRAPDLDQMIQTKLDQAKKAYDKETE